MACWIVQRQRLSRRPNSHWRIVRPQKTNDDIEAMRETILKAPVISDVYKHYRGEFLPDRSFLVNTVTDSFHLPPDKAEEFVKVFLASLADAKLLEEINDKTRVLDVTHAADAGASVAAADEHLKKVSRGVSIEVTDTCFVMMPFQTPLGGYFDTVYFQRAKTKEWSGREDLNLRPPGPEL
jgi:hypothetical protein